MSVLAGIGTAGVPGGSLPLIVIVLQSVGVPAKASASSSASTASSTCAAPSLNVTGDLVIATCVARWEGRNQGSGAASQKEIIAS